MCYSRKVTGVINNSNDGLLDLALEGLLSFAALSMRELNQAGRACCVCVQVRMFGVGGFRPAGSSRVLLGLGGLCWTSCHCLRGPELQWRVILRALALHSVLWNMFAFTCHHERVECCYTATTPVVVCGRRAAMQWKKIRISQFSFRLTFVLQFSLACCGVHIPTEFTL